MAKEKTPLAPIIRARQGSRTDLFVWIWAHKVAVIVCAVLIILSIQFREALWACICWTWDAGRSLSQSAAEQIDTDTSSSADTTFLVVKAGPTNVRAKPSKSSAKVAVLQGGAKVYPLGEPKGGWLHVRLEGGQEGYIQYSLLKEP